jgi:hypothetical protein
MQHYMRHTVAWRFQEHWSAKISVSNTPLCSCCSWVKLRWYQYEMTYGPYMLELWERNLVLAFIISVVAFTLYGTYSVVQRFLQ